jgi:hypothetical protein
MGDHIGKSIEQIVILALFSERNWSLLPPSSHRLSAAQKLMFLAETSLLAEELVASISRLPVLC